MSPQAVHPVQSKPEYWGGDIPWIATGTIDFNVITEPTEYISEAGLKNSSARLYPKGTLLMAMFGQGVTRGKVAILGASPLLIRLALRLPLTKETIHPIYFTTCPYYNRIRNLGQVGTQSNLNAGLIRSFLFTRPLPNEQVAIAKLAETWDAAIAQTAKLIEEKRKLKKGLMQQLLTGKQQLPEFREPWLKKKLGEVFCERKETNYPMLPLLSITEIEV